MNVKTWVVKHQQFSYLKVIALSHLNHEKSSMIGFRAFKIMDTVFH